MFLAQKSIGDVISVIGQPDIELGWPQDDYDPSELRTTDENKLRVGIFTRF